MSDSLAIAKSARSVHGVTDFVSWTWDMVNRGHPEIGWNVDGTHILVSNPNRMVSNVLHMYSRLTQFASWVRALNNYGFKKYGVNTWGHPNFVRNKPELLINIKRQRLQQMRQHTRVAVIPTQSERLLTEKRELVRMRLEVEHLEVQMRDLKEKRSDHLKEVVGVAMRIFTL